MYPRPWEDLSSTCAYQLNNRLPATSPNNHAPVFALGAEPLKIAFPWMFFCFIGYIETDQVFLLFDRIIGFRSLEILPVLAVGIFRKRAIQLLACQDLKEVESHFQGYLPDLFLETVRDYFNQSNKY